MMMLPLPDPELPLKRARTGNPTSIPLSQPTFQLRAASEGNEALTITLRNTPLAVSRQIDSEEDFLAFLDSQCEAASRRFDQWLRHPKAKWVADIIEDLSEGARADFDRRRRQLEMLNLAPDKLSERWEETSDLATYAVHLWLDEKSLEEVIDKSRGLGQLSDEPEVSGGCILEGEFVRRIAANEDIDFGRLMPMIQSLARGSDYVQAYEVDKGNCFGQGSRGWLPLRSVTPREGMGSLNTTWDYDDQEEPDPQTSKGKAQVPLLDDYYELMKNVLKPCTSCNLNERLYMIWKFQNYVTSYHQDTHVPPHCTIYNQVSGASLFHFLPLLLGLYVTRLGHRDVHALKGVLEDLDKRGIGRLATIGPGNVAFIHPAGSHGVWVPSVRLNKPVVPEFEVSLIRAAELFVTSAMRWCRDRLRGRDWNYVAVAGSEEKRLLQAFQKAQAELCEEHNLCKADWSWCARTLVQQWNDEERAMLAASRSKSMMLETEGEDDEEHGGHGCENEKQHDRDPESEGHSSEHDGQ